VKNSESLMASIASSREILTTRTGGLNMASDLRQSTISSRSSRTINLSFLSVTSLQTNLDMALSQSTFCDLVRLPKEFGTSTGVPEELARRSMNTFSADVDGGLHRGTR
jgi:hypothetical protein